MKRTLKAPEHYREGATVEFKSLSTRTRLFIGKVVRQINDDYYWIEDRLGHEGIVAANRLAYSIEPFIHVNTALLDREVTDEEKN